MEETVKSLLSSVYESDPNTPDAIKQRWGADAQVSADGRSVYLPSQNVTVPINPDGTQDMVRSTLNSGNVVTNALTGLAGSELGSVLTGRAVLQGGIKEQDMSSAGILDVFGSPATAGTDYQDAARAAAIAYGGYMAAGGLAGAAGSGAGGATAAESSALAGAGDMFGSGAAYEAGAAGLGSGAATGTAAAGGLIGTEAALGAGGGATGTVGAAGGAAAGGAAAGAGGTAAGGGAAVAGGSALSRILGGNASDADWLQVLGTTAATGLGLYGSNQQAGAMSELANKYFEVGAPSRARYEASFAPDFKPEDIPGYQGAVDTSMQSLLRQISAKDGNPWGSPGGTTEALKYVTGNIGLPAIQNYRNQNAATGGFGAFSSAAPAAATGAIGAQGNTYNVLGAGIADLTQPRRRVNLGDIYSSLA